MSDPRRTPSIFTRGAVDLGALRQSATATAQRTPAADQAATGPTGASGPAGFAGPSGPAGASPGAAAVIIDVDEATFQTEVLERSLQTPVVVDFWAEWCQPCKQLSPVLEKLAVEGEGAWVLAKVDIDANQRLAQMFRIQSIPLVYAIVGGQPVDAFNGVIPESQLRQWIAAVVKAGGVEVETPEDPRLSAADEAMAEGDLDAAERAYRKILSDAPADAAAEAGLAQVALLRRTLGVDLAGALQAAAAAPTDVAAQSRAADVEVISGDAPAAYARLIELVRRTSGEEREAVRKHLISLFTMASPDDPAVAAARRSLANALF
jgi:putative thioredoxin